MDGVRVGVINIGHNDPNDKMTLIMYELKKI